MLVSTHRRFHGYAVWPLRPLAWLGWFPTTTALILVLLCQSGAMWSSEAGGAPIRFALVGDSTVASDFGWGDAFLARLQSGATGVNLGICGASSKSYRNNTVGWTKALAAHPTHILIQFGHNDMPGKGPKLESDPATTFKENLRRYIKEARAAGAQPILVTSMVRRTFRDGKLDDPLAPYADAAIAVAKEQQVPLVDLHALSKALVERLGPQGCETFNPKSSDFTHLTPAGGKVFAALVIDALVAAEPSVARCFAAQ